MSTFGLVVEKDGFTGGPGFGVGGTGVGEGVRPWIWPEKAQSGDLLLGIEYFFSRHVLAVFLAM